MCQDTVIFKSKLISASLWFKGRMEGSRQDREHKSGNFMWHEEMKKQNKKLETWEDFFFKLVEQYSMGPENLNSETRRPGFTLQLSYCLALCSWTPNLTSLGPVSSPVTTNNKGTFLGRLLGKSMYEECLAQGQAHSEKSIYRGCSNC